MSKTKIILRWIAVPFAAIAAMMIGHIVGTIIQAFCLNYVLIGEGEIVRAVSGIIGELTGGICFVAGGTWVAPKANKIVSVVLATAAVVISIISLLFLCFVTKNVNLIGIIEVLFFAAGSVIYSYNTYNDSTNIL